MEEEQWTVSYDNPIDGRGQLKPIDTRSRMCTRSRCRLWMSRLGRGGTVPGKGCVAEGFSSSLFSLSPSLSSPTEASSIEAIDALPVVCLVRKNSGKH